MDSSRVSKITAIAAFIGAVSGLLSLGFLFYQHFSNIPSITIKFQSPIGAGEIGSFIKGYESNFVIINDGDKPISILNVLYSPAAEIVSELPIEMKGTEFPLWFTMILENVPFLLNSREVRKVDYEYPTLNLPLEFNSNKDIIDSIINYPIKVHTHIYITVTHSEGITTFMSDTTETSFYRDLTQLNVEINKDIRLITPKIIKRGKIRNYKY